MPNPTPDLPIPEQSPTPFEFALGCDTATGGGGAEVLFQTEDGVGITKEGTTSASEIPPAEAKP